jgi:hypothetical protein
MVRAVISSPFDRLVLKLGSVWLRRQGSGDQGVNESDDRRIAGAVQERVGSLHDNRRDGSGAVVRMDNDEGLA